MNASQAGPLTVERGPCSAGMLAALAGLRIAVFHAWPYLYAGSEAYERGYLAEFLDDARSVLVVARLGETPIGMATASPLAAQPEAIRAPLRAAGLDAGATFYFGESVLLPEYRGLGIGHRFFDEREAAAREAGATVSTFCAVIRPAGHPLRPPQARDLAPFWRARGYAPLPGATTRMDWRDIDQPASTAHPMQFWQRRL